MEVVILILLLKYNPNLVHVLFLVLTSWKLDLSRKASKSGIEGVVLAT